MSLVTTIQHYVNGLRVERHRRRTRELVNALPPDIQKDIGWRGFIPDTDHYRHDGPRH